MCKQHHIGGVNPRAKLCAHLLRLLLWFVLIAKLASSLYASLDARGLYSDGAAYLVGIYGDKWFLTFDLRTTVQIAQESILSRR